MKFDAELHSDVDTSKQRYPGIPKYYQFANYESISNTEYSSYDEIPEKL